MGATDRRQPRLRREAGSRSDRVTHRRVFLPRIRELRWLVGLLLMALGAAGCLRVLAVSDHTRTVWVAQRTLMPGESLARQALQPHRVRLDSVASAYLSVEEEWPRGGVVAERILKGELVPRSALIPAQELDTRPVTIRARYAQGRAMRPGARADLWVAQPDGKQSGKYGKASLVLPDVLIGSLSPVAGHRSWGEERSVEVYLPTSAVSGAIDDLNAGARMTLVPTRQAPPS